MFVQATKSKRQNKTYVSYLVRESFRTSEGPRSRTVCNISALPPEVRDLVAAALSGQTCVVLEQIELSHALDYGGLAVLREAWQRFGLEKLFADVPQVRQRRLLQTVPRHGFSWERDRFSGALFRGNWHGGDWVS